MISSNELESVRAGGDEIEAKFEGASLGNKIFSGENLSCQISVPYLAAFPKCPLSRLNHLQYHGNGAANQRERREERGHKSDGVNCINCIQIQTKSNLIIYE